MFLDVADGAEVVLLFSRPEGHTNRSPRLDADGLDDACGLHGHRDACAVVRRARAAVPGIQVTAEHHDFRSERGVRPGNLGDDVEAVDILDESRRETQRELHRLLLVEHAHDPAVVLARDHEAGKRRMPEAIEETADADVGADAARLDERRNAFGGEELVDLDLLVQDLAVILFFLGERFGRARLGGRRRLDVAFELLQLVVGQSVGNGLKSDVNRLGAPVHHNRAAQLAAILVEVVLRLHLDDNRSARQWRRRRRRPRPRIAGDAKKLRLDHLDRKPFERPPAADGAVRFERRVRESPAGHLVARPLARRPQRRRSGQPRAVDVRNPAEGLHHRRVLKPFGLDLRDDALVDLLRRSAGAFAARLSRHDRGQRDRQAERTRGRVSIPGNHERILRARRFGAPALVDEHEAGFGGLFGIGGFRIPRVAWQDQHPPAVFLEHLRLAPADAARTGPLDRVGDTAEALQLAERGPRGRREHDFSALRLGNGGRRSEPGAVRRLRLVVRGDLTRRHTRDEKARVELARVHGRRDPVREEHQRVERESKPLAFDHPAQRVLAVVNLVPIACDPRS